MVGFCIHCGASTPNEFVVVNGEVLSSPYVRCSYCGKMAGIRDKMDEDHAWLEVLDKTGEVVVKDGKIAHS